MVNNSDSNLFKSIDVGASHLSNRLVMAPLTRFRSPNHIANELNIEYYAQRASYPGTLLITEGTFVSAQAGGFPDVPGLYTPEQIAQWKKIVDAVHKKKSFIFMQLWALGRSADKSYIESTGQRYVSSSATPTSVTSVAFVREMASIQGHNKLHPDAPKALPPLPPKQPPPHALTEPEILQFIADYAQAAKNAIAAGADGVEIHGANFYLPEQFLSEYVNKRTDKWGGSIENRARFHLAVVDAVVEAIGAERTALRLSPWGFYAVNTGASPIPQWSYLINELEKRCLPKGRYGKHLAYLHLIEPRGVEGALAGARYNHTANNDVFASLWTGPLIKAGGFTGETAAKEADADPRVLIAMGRYFISTPDIVSRVKNGDKPNPYDRSTFYSEGKEGYTDYPFQNKL